MTREDAFKRRKEFLEYAKKVEAEMKTWAPWKQEFIKGTLEASRKRRAGK